MKILSNYNYNSQYQKQTNFKANLASQESLDNLARALKTTVKKLENGLVEEIKDITCLGGQELKIHVAEINSNPYKLCIWGDHPVRANTWIGHKTFQQKPSENEVKQFIKSMGDAPPAQTIL